MARLWRLATTLVLRTVQAPRVLHTNRRTQKRRFSLAAACGATGMAKTGPGPGVAGVAGRLDLGRWLTSSGAGSFIPQGHGALPAAGAAGRPNPPLGGRPRGGRVPALGPPHTAPRGSMIP